MDRHAYPRTGVLLNEASDLHSFLNFKQFEQGAGNVSALLQRI
jgi:hypothetical protein